MAKAYKCDSCGRYFQFDNHEQSRDYYCGRYVNASMEVPVRVDLCPECYTEFSEFMKKFLDKENGPWR